MNQNNYGHRRASSNDMQQFLCARIAGLVEEDYQQPKFDMHRLNFGSTLFQIPEQNDLASSIEQTQESSQKSQQLIRDLQTSQKKKNNSQDQKENLKNISSCSNLISQIQQIVQGGQGIKEITQNAINSDRQNSQMSFTKELQKKSSQNYLQYQKSTQGLKSNITPDRIRASNSKPNSQKTDKSPLQASGQDKLKSNLTVSIFNNIMSQDAKRKQSVDCLSGPFKKMEQSIKKIEKEITTMKKRQDDLDEANQNIQTQLQTFMTQNRKQQDYGAQQLRKLDQLEQITRRNEDAISQLKQSLLNNSNYNARKNDQNDKNFGNLQQYEMTDLHKKFADYKQINSRICY